MRKALPSIKNIIQYWLFDKNIFNIESFWFDFGEPECWACGNNWQGKYDNKNYSATESELAICWENAPLQRCHIVPDSLGGNNDPSNIFLLCEDCHRLAPDTIFQDAFFTWCRKQRFRDNGLSEFREALRSLNISDKDFLDYFDKCQSRNDEFKPFLFKNAGIHWDARGGKKAGIKYSTFIVLVTKFLEGSNNRMKLTLKGRGENLSQEPSLVAAPLQSSLF